MIERRSLATEVRSSGSNQISGYAAVYNVNAKLPQFQERLKPGAFSRAISERQDVVALFNHDPNFVLGRTTSGTLRLSQDAHGLAFVCDLPTNPRAAELHESIKRGDINGMSFAFHVAEDGDKWSEQRAADGTYFVQRDISDLNLQDISPVTWPCYSNTTVTARSAAAVPAELRARVDHLNAPMVEARRQAAMNEAHRQADVRAAEIRVAPYVFSNCRTVEEAEAKAKRFAAKVNEHRAAKVAAVVTTRRRNLLNAIL